MEGNRYVYLLDTNIVSALVKRPPGELRQRMESLDRGTCCTSIVVASELQYGICKKGSSKLARRVQSVLKALDILSLEPPAHRHYGEIRAALERIGRPIGHNALFIAAHARSLGLTMVTDNVREFDRVPDLKVENWLR